MRVIVALIALGALASSCTDDPRPDTTPPGAVTDLHLLRANDTTATLAWTAPGDDGDAGTAARYDLRATLGAFPADWDSALVVSGLPLPRIAGAAESAVVGGLAPDRVYRIALRSADEAGNASDLSNVVEASTADQGPPGTVTNLQAEAAGPHAVFLVFTAPGDDGAEGRAVAYAIRVAGEPITEETWNRADTLAAPWAPRPGGSYESLRVYGLEPGMTGYVAVRARDDVSRWGGVSNSAEVTLPEDTVAPGGIVDLGVAATELRQAVLGWTATGNDGWEGRATAYEVRYAEAEVTEANWEEGVVVEQALRPGLAGTAETLRVEGLPGARTLWFAVRAVDEYQNRGPVSNGVSAFVTRERWTWRIRADGTGDAPTIQAAIESAQAGDSLWVAPGRYVENLHLAGKDLVLRSEAGPDVTILDGSAEEAPVVYLRIGNTRDTLVEGFTITGGTGLVPGRDGGGVMSWGSSARIVGNHVVGNGHPYSSGGGIFAGGGEVYQPPEEVRPWIEGNLIENNTGRLGGGIGVWWGMPEIRNNTIRNNYASADGGGIWIGIREGFPIVEGNTFWRNTADDHGGGVYGTALWKMGAGVTLRGNLFGFNAANGFGGVDGAGGGVWMEILLGEISHNTFSNNDASNGGGWCPGAGIQLVRTPATFEVFGNIFYRNNGCGIACGMQIDPAFAPGPNLFWHNTGADLGKGPFTCPTAWGDTQIFIDPLFCSPIGPDYDYTLGADSPAITDSLVYGAFPEPGCPHGTPLLKPGLWGQTDGRDE